MAENSLSGLLEDVIRVQQNGLEILNSLSDIASSSKDTVTVEITQPDGSTREITVPSFGNLRSEIERLNSNVKSISSLGEGEAALRLEDGSIRRIVTTTLDTQAEPIDSITAPGSFNIQNNWFFESFLNPLLFVEFDFSSQLEPGTERVEADRYILDLDTSEKREFFRQNWKGRSDIDRDQFLDQLSANGIQFFRDNDVIDVPPTELRYEGSFSVINVKTEFTENSEDGEDVRKRRLVVTLNKLTYSDNTSRFEDTVELKVGDSLLVDKGNKDTRLEITDVDRSEKTVTLKRLEGFDSFGVGANILRIYSEDAVQRNVRVNVGYNEKTVLFIKPIDPHSKLPAKRWSPGVGFFTNELNIRDEETGEETSLATYYRNQVVDFGELVFAKAKEGIPPSTSGLTPFAPEPQSSNFEVVQVNRHLSESETVKEIEDLNSQKANVKNRIKELTKRIKERRASIETRSFNSQSERDSAENELNELVNKRDSLSTEFASIIEDINSKATEEGLEDADPKFRVRGFWPFPEPRENDTTGPQEVIKFKVRYRYINKNGGGNDPKQVDFTDQNGSVRRATFSTWEEFETKQRKRVQDEETGQFEWVTEDVEDSDEVNSNQLDIPISKNEAVEIQIKSISEAGYPDNPAESDWSDTIRVSFPSELEASFEVSSIIDQAAKEQTRVELQNEFDRLDLPEHLSGQFRTNGNTFHHTAKDITSGFLTQEQNPISLADKLQAMDQQLRELQGRIEQAKGKINVRIVDEDGNEKPVENNSVVKQFAGNYRDIVKDFNVKKGAIVTRTFFVKIENEAASPLELYSRAPGSVEETPRGSFSQASDFESNDLKYNTKYRYDAVPVGLTNPDSNDLQSNFNFNLPFQSSQVRSQFMYSRYKSVDGKNELYTTVRTDDGELIDPSTGNPVTSRDQLEFIFDPNVTQNWPSSTASGDFIWDGSSVNGVVDTSSVNFSSGQIEIHEDHPRISDFVNGNKDPVEYVRNSRYAKVEQTQQINGFEGKKQAAHYLVSNPYRSLRTGFRDDDQYLIGPHSVGAYLFLAPQSHDSISVGGSDDLSVRTIDFGPSNAISIPVIFQYRMTDYWGEGNSGIGNIGGDNSGTTDQVVYTKVLGLDIFHGREERFSFDLEVTARYKSTSLDAADVPQRTLTQAVDDGNSDDGSVNIS